MLDKTSDIAIAAESWLAEFEAALGDDGALEKLFHPDSYWRDALALSWTLQTVNGPDDIIRTLKAQAAGAAPSGFAIYPDRAAPRKVMRAGTDCIEAIFKFETKSGRGDGIIRLIPDASDGNRLKAWTMAPSAMTTGPLVVSATTIGSRCAVGSMRSRSGGPITATGSVREWGGRPALACRKSRQSCSPVWWTNSTR